MVNDLLTTLLYSIRIATVMQIAQAFHGGQCYRARRALSQLHRLGLVTQARAFLRIRPEPEQPLIDWQPGDKFVLTPGQIEYRLRKIWESAPTRRTTIVYATQKAVNFFGGRGGRIQKPLQLSHDVYTAAVYFHYITAQSEQAAHWLGEHAAIGYHRPDAVLIQDNRPYRVIEIGGLYSAKRIIELALACQQENLPLEIW